MVARVLSPISGTVEEAIRITETPPALQTALTTKCVSLNTHTRTHVDNGRLIPNPDLHHKWLQKQHCSVSLSLLLSVFEEKLNWEANVPL